jgi:hypothetical protein
MCKLLMDRHLGRIAAKRLKMRTKEPGRGAEIAIHTNMIEILMYRFVCQNVSPFHPLSSLAAPKRLVEPKQCGG